MDNYELARDRAQAYFLHYSQETVIHKWKLEHTKEVLYVNFLGRPYAICRKTGRIDRLFDGKQAGFSEVLSIFDLLCHEGNDPFLTGKFAPVNSLRGCSVSAGVDTPFYNNTAAYFESEQNEFIAACQALGGVPVDAGDIGFSFPLFDQMRVILKFYHSDEDFPASITFLWEENTLSFAFYETVFYMAGFILDEICNRMNGKN